VEAVVVLGETVGAAANGPEAEAVGHRTLVVVGADVAEAAAEAHRRRGRHGRRRPPHGAAVHRLRSDLTQRDQVAPGPIGLRAVHLGGLRVPQKSDRSFIDKQTMHST